MDPTSNLLEQLRISEDIQQSTDETEIVQLAERLAELVLTLHVWIRDGGFLPQDWSQN